MVEKNRPVYYQPTEKSTRLRELLQEAVDSRKADALLLSGGIDSSALAALDRSVPAYTTSLKGASEKLDLAFAGKVARHLKLKWTPVVVTPKEAIESLGQVIRINQSYDTAILNDVALHIAITRAAVDLNTMSFTVRSGEPADMLFRGYFATYRISQADLNTNIDRSIASRLPLAKLESKTRIRVDYPYLDSAVKEFAKTLTAEDTRIYREKVGDVWSVHPDNEYRYRGPPYPFGKLVLRQAMFGILPQEIALRSKMDIEFGSGTEKLRMYLRKTITPLERAAFESEGLSFRDDAHVALYKIFNQEGLKPVTPRFGEAECASCHGAVERKAGYCSTCGSDRSYISFDELRRIKSTARNQN